MKRALVAFALFLATAAAHAAEPIRDGKIESGHAPTPAMEEAIVCVGRAITAAANRAGLSFSDFQAITPHAEQMKITAHCRKNDR